MIPVADREFLCAAQSSAVSRSEQLDRKCRVVQRSQREDQQCDLIIVSGDTVGSQQAAAAAQVNDGPFTLPARGDRNWLHWLIARGSAVSD